MNPELLAAVKERITLGHSKEAITAALEAAGYDRATIEQVYQEAHSDYVRTAIPLADTTGAAQFSPSPEATALPGAVQLFKAGWRYMLSRLDMVGALAAVLVVMGVGGAVLSTRAASLSVAMSLVMSVVVIAASVFYLLLLIAIVRIVTQSGTEALKLKEALHWSKSHFFGFFWVGILSALVVFGGTLLFVIPGIIVSIYVYFTQYVYVTEGTRGMAAILRSVQLSTGYWWALFWRSLVIGFLSFVVMIPVLVIQKIAENMTAPGSYTMLLTQAFEQAVSAGLVVLIMFAAYTLYQHLAIARPVGTNTSVPASWKYKALAWLGVLFILLLILLSAAYGVYESGSKDNPTFVAARLSTAPVMAGTYRIEHGTLNGVCDNFQDEFLMLGAITCNDSDDAWAFTVETTTGPWCVDSTGFRKELAAPLGERVACNPL